MREDDYGHCHIAIKKYVQWFWHHSIILRVSWPRNNICIKSTSNITYHRNCHKAHQQANIILRCFTSSDIRTSQGFHCLCAPHNRAQFCCLVAMSEARCWFNWESAKTLYKATSWPEKPVVRRSFCQTQIHGLELRLLHLDLVLCYKIVFGVINVSFNDFFSFGMLSK